MQPGNTVVADAQCVATRSAIKPPPPQTAPQTAPPQPPQPEEHPNAIQDDDVISEAAATETNPVFTAVVAVARRPGATQAASSAACRMYCLCACVALHAMGSGRDVGKTCTA